MTQTIRNMEVQADGSDALRPASYIDNLVMTANVEKVYTIPAGARFLVFSSTGTFYAAYRGGSAASPYPVAQVAAVPSGDVIDGTASELNPTLRFVSGVAADGLTREITQVRLIAPANCVISIGVYA